MASNTGAIVRPAARVLVIDPADRVLLMCWQHEIINPTRHVWITPGGGVREGEEYEEAAIRELSEETGIVDVPLGPCVWTRNHMFDFGRVTVKQVERFYVVRVADVTLSRDGWTDGERRDIKDVRWWSAEEIAASEEWFTPRNLATLLPDVLAGKVPAKPIDAGV